MRLRSLWLISLTASLAVMPAAGARAASPSSLPSAADSQAIVGRRLDAATTAALETQQRINELRTQDVAITQRMAVTTERVNAQLARVDIAQAAAEKAQSVFDDRISAIYVRGPIDPLTILLSSESISDLFARASLLTRITEQDETMVRDLNLAAAEQRYQAAVLDDLRAQDIQLRSDQKNRLVSLQASYVKEKELIAGLTAQSKALLAAAQKQSAAVKRQWVDSSIPVGDSVAKATAIVLPDTDRTYVCAAYMPRTYRSTGTTFRPVCSWYGNEFNGRPTSSGRIFNENDFTCASKTLPFGTVLALTRGSRRIIVVVDDRGPFVAGRDLDLSKAAAAALGYSGVATVDAQIVVAAK